MSTKSVFALLACVSLLLVGCSNSKKNARDVEEEREVYIQKPGMALGANDTAEVLGLVNLYLQKVQYKDFDGATSMLFHLDGEKIERLSAALAKKEQMSMHLYPVYATRIDELQFFKETDSKVKAAYIVQDPKKLKAGQKPAEITVAFRPVRRGGRWFLTLADTQSETSTGSELDK